MAKPSIDELFITHGCFVRLREADLTDFELELLAGVADVPDGHVEDGQARRLGVLQPEDGLRPLWLLMLK